MNKLQRPNKAISLLMLVAVTLLLSTPTWAQNPVHEPVRFDSHGVTLSGSIVWPNDEITAALVFVHGSGNQSRNIALADRFARHGVVALVYDKRGVGLSGGRYESQQSVSGPNIELLADDAGAALKQLRSHPRLAQVPVGLAGISQAGWIAPLAAEKTQMAQFLLMWSGPVCKVSEEDIFSKYTKDLDLTSVPAYGEALAARKVPYVWPEFLGRDTDPSTSLSRLQIPGLWLFGAKDGSVPVDLSMARLDELRASGGNFHYVLFSQAGHNNIDATFATALAWLEQQHKNL